MQSYARVHAKVLLRAYSNYFTQVHFDFNLSFWVLRVRWCSDTTAVTIVTSLQHLSWCKFLRNNPFEVAQAVLTKAAGSRLWRHLLTMTSSSIDLISNHTLTQNRNIKPTYVHLIRIYVQECKMLGILPMLDRIISKIVESFVIKKLWRRMRIK